jgi:hypothetical protein
MNTIHAMSNSPSWAVVSTEDNQISVAQQIIAHLGGMAHAFIRHRPIKWKFHWCGIRRAISEPTSVQPEAFARAVNRPTSEPNIRATAQCQISCFVS